MTSLQEQRCWRMWIALFILVALFAPISPAQSPSGTLRGRVTDPSGAVIADATVTATAADGRSSSATTNRQGTYEIKGLPPGQYTVSAAGKGFKEYKETGVQVTAGQVQQFDIGLGIEVQVEHVAVEAQSTGVQVSSSENASSIVIKGKDLEALSDDPDELQSELEALAGPSAGPNGGQIYIDGFTGGQLPPKSSIREIRVNQNPFSAEYDKLGYGRIEIYTKPGTDKYHGQFFFNDTNSALNSRNPFVNTEPSYQSEIFDGNLGGPLGKKASFFIDAQRRNINDLAIINALVADPVFSNPAGVPFSQAVPTPAGRTNISPRIDYQLTSNNTLTLRYQFEQETHNNEGIGQTALASQGYHETETENSLQASDSQIINSHMLNETRFRYVRDQDNVRAQSFAPATQVLGYFTSGGSLQGTNLDHTDRYELQNYTSITHGKHYIRFGGRLRVSRDSSFSNQNFNGAFTFPSLAAYDVTEAGRQNGLTPAQSRAACLAVSPNPQTAQCGASQLSITQGQPSIENTLEDTGVFAEDNWRVRPNITLDFGLRLETQNVIQDHADLSPRLGFAWGWGSKNGTPKTVLRAGSGLFYDRFQQRYVLNALRLNGIAQQQTILNAPDCYPDPANCSGGAISAATYRIGSQLRAPYVIQSAASIERQLSKAATVSVTYLNSRGVHQFLSRNINAPLPGTYNPANPGSGVFPLGSAAGNIYEYESVGIFKQNQIIANVRVSKGAKLSLFGFYMLNYANGNTQGVSSFPSNQYDLGEDYGRSVFDVRHRAFIGGSIFLPYRFMLNPFIVANSGTPFNITLGQDLNGDSIFNDRPALVSTNTCPQVSVSGTAVCSPWGTFSSILSPGARIVPINYGTGPDQVSINLRLSRTFGFGREVGGGPRGGEGRFGGGGRRGGPPGGGLGPGGLGGGPMGNPFANAGTSRRYNLTFSISARNLFNTQNLAPPVGDINSSRFGQSIALARGFFGSESENRRIDLQVRFSF